MSDKRTPQTINAKPDENGNVIVNLYGRNFDVTALVKDGVAEAKLIGQKYRIVVEYPAAPKRKAASRSAKKPKTQEVDQPKEHDGRPPYNGYNSAPDESM